MSQPFVGFFHHYYTFYLAPGRGISSCSSTEEKRSIIKKWSFSIWSFVMCPCDLRVNRNKPKICSIGIKPINYKNMNLKTANHLGTFLFVFILMSFQFSIFFFIQFKSWKWRLGVEASSEVKWRTIQSLNTTINFVGASFFMLPFTSVVNIRKGNLFNFFLKNK